MHNCYFSYAGAKKKNVRENKQEVVDVIQRSLSGTKKVIIRAFAREKIEDRVFSLVLECMIPRKLRKRKRKWELEGYQLVEPYLGPFVTPSNQTFRARFEIYIRKYQNSVCYTIRGIIMINFKYNVETRETKLG